MADDKKDALSEMDITVLPASAARVVSLVTRTSSLSLQVGTLIGGLAISGVRYTTLTGLEVGRVFLEGVLNRAGRDISERSLGELGRTEADGVVQRSITALHSTITNISFAASTGFYLTSTILNSAGDFSQHLLGLVDHLFGSTDTSRSIASIVTLIRREFANPATGKEGEKVGISDLLVGLLGLAILQKLCEKITQDKEGEYEQILWDVVVLNDGRKADVVAANNNFNQHSVARAGSSMSFVAPGTRDMVETIERAGFSDNSDDDLPELNLKRKIMESVSTDASVTITTETTSTKTITVDVFGVFKSSDLLSPPDGIEIVEMNELVEDARQSTAENDSKAPKAKHQRVVYRVIHHKTRQTNIASMGPDDNDEEANSGEVETLLQPDLSNTKDAVFEIESSTETPSKKRTASTASIHSLDSLHSLEALVSKIPVPRSSDNLANQKRSRKALSPSSAEGSSPVKGVEPIATKKATPSKATPSSTPSSKRPSPKVTEKKHSFRNAIRKGSSSALSHMWSKETTEAHSAKSASKPAWGMSSSKSSIPGPQRNHSSNIVNQPREAPRPPQRGNPNYFSSRDLGLMQAGDRSESRASYYSVHEQRRDSMVSQTDMYTIHSVDNRPTSPAAFRSRLEAPDNMLRARSESSMSNQLGSSSKQHRKSHSHVPSIYTMKSDSQQSLTLYRPRTGAFDDSQVLPNLIQTGTFDGLFPAGHHIVRNISRFVRFSSASYGSHFLRIMGISSSESCSVAEFHPENHYEHHSFTTHSQLPPNTVLLSSFHDPAGGSDARGHTETGVPMVHYISLDHQSKAVVLTCRGTLGFEDVLTDMTCDYDELSYRGTKYNVHKGIHASARRLLDSSKSRVMATIAAALEEFPSYGLVLCGHSLGGGVVSLLAILISEPSSEPDSTFFTSAKLVPSGRPVPVHVYAYGPPATVSPSLRLATRGLITTVVCGQDLVPYLSLGVLHDFQGVALAFKTDDTGAKSELRKHVSAGIFGRLKEWYAQSVPGQGAEDKDEGQWAYSALKALRASMLSPKLLPPGEVFIVETTSVLQRNAFAMRRDGDGGQPATRSVLKYVRDVEKRFGEVRWGASCLLDHSPGRYEASLGALAKGVLT